MYDFDDETHFVGERRFKTPEPRASSPDLNCWTTPEPETEKPNPTPDFIFDTGNIRLLVKVDGKVIEGKVASEALCLASPVWKKFLFPPWKAEEELRHSVKQIDCTEDDSTALLILLNIVHSRFEKVPEHVQYRTLLSIATLCDQYDCVKLVRPWLVDNLWLRGEKHESVKIGQHKWLFIAWVFGRTATFQKLAMDLVKDIRVDSEEEWMSVAPMPPEIIESILSKRRATIASILEIIYDVLNSYEATVKPCTKEQSWGRSKNVCKRQYADRDKCDAIVYGSLVLGLQSINLYPRKCPEDIAISINELAHQLKQLNILRLPCKDGVKSDHGTCGIFKSVTIAIDRALLCTGDPSQQSHYTHMRAQCERLGR
ncbi:uncharacterized protein PAC_14568 [Phialocephala subalpina]|uniref:BTB domain-containing protein n=1 Tax=Phialocephala subalpina TaxID=576137 RepID=A0A1L7XI04_9HELO|nr:uncharacterized protein PAC_14568 [Phialocephala subalpina]